MKSNNQESILIFGIDSFTGKHLEVLLEKEYEILGTTFNGEETSEKFNCDITQISDVERIIEQTKPDYIINFSGISFVPFENHKTIYDVNYFGVVNIVNSLKNLGHYPKKIIFPSTAQVYEENGKKKINEVYDLNPQTHYSISKRTMELYLNTVRDEFNIIITRPFNYIGQGQHENFLIPKIANHFKNHSNVIELGDIEVYRDFTDVRDVVNAYKLLLKANDVFIVNICSGTYHSVKHVFTMFGEISQHNMKIKVNQKYIRVKNLKYQCGDNQLLKSIGWKQKYSLKETLEWCLDN